MTKLIAKYQATPTRENAVKVAEYAHKHPMAECMLTPHEQTILAYCKSAR